MTIKQYKKKYYICKDDNGKMIYAGDTVELCHPLEIKSSYQSKVYWNRVDGAFVNPHPTHVKIGITSYKTLSGFLGKQEFKIYYNDDEFNTYQTKCIKVKSFYY